MTKKYYVNVNEVREKRERGFLELDSSKIDEMIDLGGTIYVRKTDIENVDEYKQVHVDEWTADRFMNVEESGNCIYTNDEDFTREEIDYIISGWGDDEEELEKSIIEKMKKNHMDMGVAPDTKIYEYWDGSNWKYELLESDFHDEEWEDWTEEFEEAEEIDYQKENTGHYTLYKLSNYTSNALVYTSYYQGAFDTVEFVSKEYKTVQEYLDSVSKNY